MIVGYFPIGDTKNIVFDILRAMRADSLLLFLSLYPIQRAVSLIMAKEFLLFCEKLAGVLVLYSKYTCGNIF